MASETEFTVLVVDDDEPTRKGLRRLLEFDGYGVVDASSIAECLVEVERLQPFAVLLDRRLRDGMAETVLPQLKLLSPESSVVIATGFADVESSVEALRLGVADYLIKPVEPELLRNSLRRLRQQRESGRRLARTQDELRVSEERLQLVVRATRDAIWDCDLVAGTLWCNGHFEEMFGAQDADCGASYDWRFERIHAEDRDRVRASMQAALVDGTERWQEEYRYLCTGGRIADVVDRALISRDEGGAPIRILGAMTDVSERRRLEAEILQAQKMDAIGRLAGGVAHDFNNLLAGVVSCCSVATEMLVSGEPKDQAQALELLKTMEQRALRGASMTRQLLDFSRVRRRETVCVDLIGLVEETQSMLRRVLGEDIDLQVRSPRRAVYVGVDVGLMEQVIMNLAVNARDAMPHGGQLVLAISTKVQEGDPARPKLAPGEYAVLEVKDSGIGMSSETAARVFDPFYTTKPQGKGTGLGLATVFGLVQDFAGHIELESAIGDGATFRLFLPLIEPNGEAEDVQIPKPDHSSEAAGTILLVEDENLLRMAIRLQLRGAGYVVLDASTPQEALELVGRGDQTFDLLLSDIVMPGMNGPELARSVKALQPDVRIMFMSGYSDESLIGQGRVEAGVAILEKPFEEVAMLSRIREILA